MNFFFWRTDENPSTPEEEEGGTTQEMQIALDGLEGPKQKMVELQKKLNGKKSVPPTSTPTPTPTPTPVCP